MHGARWTSALTRADADRPGCRRRGRMPLPFGPLGGERSPCLIECDALADVKPAFKHDANIVPVPPRESAFSHCEKVVERDVERYRKKAQSARMYNGVRSGHVVGHNAQFSAVAKEQQAIHAMFDHGQSNPRYVAALDLVV